MGDKITHCNFRDKKFGWGSHVETFTIGNKGNVSKSIFKDLFYRHFIIRESCHNCPYTSLNRVSDITVGDFWGWNNISERFCDGKGVSLILINTDKGRELLDVAGCDLLLESSNTRDCLQPQLIHPADRPLEKDKFWYDYNTKGFEYVLRKYAVIGFRKNIRDVSEHINVFVQKGCFHLKRLLKR